MCEQAGLFSAVLTAFLAVSVVLLQPDNSQLSVQLLSLIALQNGAPERMQPYLNATAESLPTSTSFQAPSSAVAINALWFISLVLSLLAALFILAAQQWIRHYLLPPLLPVSQKIELSHLRRSSIGSGQV